MNNSSETLREYDRRYVWHPFTQMKEWEEDEPIVISRGEGSYLIDTEGNRYLDNEFPKLDRIVKITVRPPTPPGG